MSWNKKCCTYCCWVSSLLQNTDELEEQRHFPRNPVTVYNTYKRWKEDVGDDMSQQTTLRFFKYFVNVNMFRPVNHCHFTVVNSLIYKINLSRFNEGKNDRFLFDIDWLKVHLFNTDRDSWRWNCNFNINLIEPYHKLLFNHFEF